MIRAAGSAAIVADHTKFSARGFVAFAGAGDVHALFTTAGVPAARLEAMRKAGLTVEICAPNMEDTPLPEPAIAVLHTSPATIEVFGKLLRERLPGRRVLNILDDSILPELRDNGGDCRRRAPAWRAYAHTARDRGPG
jgi:hypothetical protein